jgi:hypothetical protein
LRKHSTKIAAIVSVEMRDKRFQLFCFLAEVPCGADELSELLFGEFAESFGREGVVFFLDFRWRARRCANSLTA